MRPTFDTEDELDLPPADGHGDEADEGDGVHEELEAPFDVGDAFDDATGEDAPVDDVPIDPVEVAWLEGSEDAENLDIGPLDIVLGGEERLVDHDEPDGRAIDEDLGGVEESVLADSGEEGPLADDEELREEDLPALDADEAGDVDDEELYDQAILEEQEELLWDDRAWERDDAALGPDLVDDPDDSGVLVVPSEDASSSARDVTWRRFEETGQVGAAAYLPGGSVVVALATADHARALLVRIQPDGVARIIAEIDPTARAVDDGEACRVTTLTWDGARGVLVVGGTFGTQVFRPAL